MNLCYSLCYKIQPTLLSHIIAFIILSKHTTAKPKQTMQSSTNGRWFFVVVPQTAKRSCLHCRDSTPCFQKSRWSLRGTLWTSSTSLTQTWAALCSRRAGPYPQDAESVCGHLAGPWLPSRSNPLSSSKQAALNRALYFSATTISHPAGQEHLPHTLPSYWSRGASSTVQKEPRTSQIHAASPCGSWVQQMPPHIPDPMLESSGAHHGFPHCSCRQVIMELDFEIMFGKLTA